MDGSLSTLSGVFAQRYSIERTLGRGATANVYLARETSSDRPVAIKVLRQEIAETMGEGRFLREIKLTQGLHHPRILPVLDSGEFEGRPYFVLPYMDGGTLRARLQREHQLPLEEAVQIACTIADALAHAHQQGYVHRDVKPENILFSSGEACLADFGIARAIERSTEDSTTSTGIARGTAAYMSPEQASGSHDYDGRSDIYSLACVLYEMIAGMQAFMGPTSQAVIAQRFLHSPRELSVYRSAVPAKLDAAIHRALQLTPADRYKNAVEFANALREITAEDFKKAERARGRFRALLATPARQIAMASIAILAVAAVAFTSTRRWARHIPTVAADTTYLVLFPLEGQTSPDAHWRDDDLMHQALSRWKGLHVVDEFQVADGVRRAGPTLSPSDAASLAASLGAGRYIRGQVTPLGTARRAYVALYDVATNRPLYTAARSIPRDLAGAAEAYAQLADSLLLRGSTVDSVPGTPFGTHSLPDLQAFSRAQTALDDWDLVAADSAFQAATVFDPDYARASLWLAQVRAWRGLAPSTWNSVAGRAAHLSDQLSDREHLLGNALMLLGRQEYARACAEYSRLRIRNDRDFAAWFGLGQCRMMDRVVVPDSTSPSKWRFRSSAAPAMEAYATAFGILPSVHRGYERGAFENLQNLLLVSTDLRVGYGASDSALFYGRPGWVADSLVIVPYPWQAMFAGDSSPVPPGFQTAVARRRTAFRRIAAGWSTAFPQSAGAKHAVAVSLDLLADPTAVDTLALARRLEPDPGRRLRLAAEQIVLTTKFGAPDDLPRLQAIRSLADSLLANTGELTLRDASALAPIAALSGHCAQLDSLVHAMVPAVGSDNLPAFLLGDANALTGRVALGCGGGTVTLQSLSLSIERRYANTTASELERVQRTLLYRPIMLAPETDRAVSDRFTRSSTDSLLVSVNAFLRRDKKRATVALKSVEARVDPVVQMPDMILARSRLWVALGEPARAIVTLDRGLDALRLMDSKTLSDPGNAASLISAMVLRAKLARATGDTANTRRWGSAAAVLLSKADSQLPGVIRNGGG